MARAAAGLPAGIRLSDHVSLGVIARTFPLDQVQQILAETGKASERERDLPAHVIVYYAIALALYAGSLTGSPSCMRCGWCGASCRCSRPFPPRHRHALHKAVLDEILEERVASSRGRQVPRGVKRKMSNYQLRPRVSQPTIRIDFAAAIRIIK